MNKKGGGAYHVFEPRSELLGTQVEAIVPIAREANENEVEVDWDRDVGLKVETWAGSGVAWQTFVRARHAAERVAR